ncbi:MAG: hypothetical protein NZL85_11500, partial [Fimbriimonadales bacterium]|nr:hypothetical protein [Fimbriimonadales bacterium]
MTNWHSAWLAGLIFGLIGSGGVAHAQTEIRVTNLLGEGAITDPLPVQVELRQRGASTRGVLEWWSEPDLRYRLPVELPAGAHKVVHLALPLNAWHPARGGNGGEFRVPTLLWRSEAGDWCLLEVPFAWNNRLPVVVIGDVQGGFEAWRRATFALEYRFGSQEVRSGDWTLEPIYWSPASVPPEWRALLGIPAIVLVEGSERLLGDQWDALLAWLLAGGHLIVSVGSIGTPLRGTPLAPLLPPLGERVVVDLRQGSSPAQTPKQGIFGSAEPRPSGSLSRSMGEGQGVRATSQIALIRSPGWDDAIAYVRDGDALIACSRRVGRGTLTLVF